MKCKNIASKSIDIIAKEKLDRILGLTHDLIFYIRNIRVGGHRHSCFASHSFKDANDPFNAPIQRVHF